MSIRFLILSLFLFISAATRGQVLTATASLDSSIILIGDQTTLTIDVRYPASLSGNGKTAYTWQPFTDSITGKIEVVSQLSTDSSLSTNGGTVLISYNYLITSWDSGHHVIPPVRFYKQGDTSRFFETQALLLEVRTIPVDTTAAPKAIVPPIDAPLTLKEILPWIGGGLAVILVLALILWFLLRKKRKDTTPEIYISPKAAHELALERLAALKEEAPWKQGQVKLYFSNLTDILRQYLTDRYGMDAMELTSSEILLHLENKAGEKEKDQMREILLLADLAKFARTRPGQDECREVMDNAVSFVEATTPPPVEQTEQEENA